jgi:glycosyltransferase involved in cell wall biosynthesis
MKISIIVPIYNEKGRAIAFLPSLAKLPLDQEVIIVDDGSTDGTSEELADFVPRFGWQLFRLPNNQGKGAAVRRGLAEAKGDYAIICDADGEYLPEDIARLLQAAPQDGLVAVYGSRWLGKKEVSFHHFVNWLLTSLFNLLFKTRLTDMETCFKLIPQAALKKMDLRCSKFEIEPEISAQLLKAGYRIKEVAISYRRRNYAQGKKIRAKDGFLALREIWRQRFRR